MNRFGELKMDINNHYFLTAKNRGYNQELTGKVGFVYVLVSDPVSNWKNQSDVDECVKKIRQVSKLLMTEAAKQHVDLQISNFVMKGRAQRVINYDSSKDWQNDVVRSMNRESLRDLQNEIKSARGFKEVVVIFMFNRVERSFAHPVTTNLFEDEFAVLYTVENPESIAHEILHLFGAVDYYYLESVRRAAKQYLDGGIMATSISSKPIDDLTMYLIGWHRNLSPKASAFLRATGNITKTEWENALKSQVKDGHGRLTFQGGIIYEGTIKHGLPDGYGTYFYPDGSKYTGEIKSAKLHGTGKLVYAKKQCYDGEWENGKMKGRGVLSYPNGDYYVGTFADNTFNGYGEYHHASGKIQKGTWKNGKLK